MSSPNSVLSKLHFVDLYIGEDYCDIKGLQGADAARVQAPLHLMDTVKHLRELCHETYTKQEEPEFSIIFDDVMFRVTAMADVMNKEVFILRRSTAEIRNLNRIGLSPALTQFIMHRETSGLVLCVGEMAAGKTSSIASMFKERLVEHGGIGLAIEDPPETKLNGEHGKGRCIQVRASRKNGGYREQLIRAVRSGADMILVGEIRDEDTAFQAAQASINGHLIMSTMHGGSIIKGIERYATYCKSKTENAYGILADGLAAVFWQGLEKVPKQGGNGFSIRLQSEYLILNGPDGQSARSKIREGKFHQLVQEIEEQKSRNVWQPGK